jgi:hypothetical protein
MFVCEPLQIVNDTAVENYESKAFTDDKVKTILRYVDNTELKYVLQTSNDFCSLGR